MVIFTVSRYEGLADGSYDGFMLGNDKGAFDGFLL
jgi:hypothetical protein